MSGRAVSAPLLERALVWLLGAFVLVQFFGLPLLALGPWALWPSVAELLFWAALPCALLYSRAVPDSHRPALWALGALVGLFALSLPWLLVMGDARLGVSLPFGAYAVYKAAQVLAVFWMVSRLPRAALQRWGGPALLGFALMVIGVVWTYFSPAIPEFFGEFLPRGRGVAGPWESYYLHHEHGLGTVGYNHGHVAAVLLLQAAFVVMLRPAWAVPVLLALVVACFLSGSRAGLAGALLFAALQGSRFPLRFTVALLVGGGAALLVMPDPGAQFENVLQRQATILEAGNTENLAGRAEIWEAYFADLRADPLRALLGSGAGSGVGNIGANAHMLPLQVVYETGLVGMTALLLFFGVLLTRLRRLATVRAVVAVHLIAALWLTAATTETFYPTPAFGSFLPMLALVLAVALHPDPEVPLE